ncbi:MAG: DUF3604 domain-containing protein [Myxococcales bacterium]|nr:DUF3604 domain-containing protein [Myxococcales bacterium]
MLGVSIMSKPSSLRVLALLLLGCALPSCGGDREASVGDAAVQRSATAAAPAREGPPHAVWEVVDALRASRDLSYHPSDGGGSARLVRGPEQKPYAVVGTPDRFDVVYEVGPHGIATGGMIYFQVSPFWNWTTPQVVSPDAPGYTLVTPSDAGIELHAQTLDEQLLGIQVTGRPLVAGDRIEIAFGAGSAGALPDTYAERRSPFFIGVDGDGDGTRRFIPDPPTIDVRPGEAVGFQMIVPTLARPGETIRIALAFLDAWHNAGAAFEGEVRFVDLPSGLALPEAVPFDAAHGGTRSVEVVAREPGVYRLRAEAGAWTAESNPLLVASNGPRVLWGDLHGHSNLSDGTGVPEDYFRYARDVSALDVVALTDHDHWGMFPLVEHPEMWREIVEQTRRFYAPGRFVTLLGFEWTSWIHGHRHVLYFGDRGELFDSVDTRTESPRQLWDALAAGGFEALTFAHHSAGGPVPTNWDIPPDPRFEPLTEIVSIHGNSEAQDAPDRIYSAIPGNFVRDALARGYRLGFVGSGDRHDGHPGAYQLEPPHGGLAAILAEDVTRESVLEALRERRVYATNGARILLRAGLGAHRMGSVVSLARGERLSAEMVVQVLAQAPLDRVEIVRSGAVVDGAALGGQWDILFSSEIADLEAGEYVYARVVQDDGGMAWSSPVFVEAPDADVR